jgi:hypothetical protein
MDNNIQNLIDNIKKSNLSETDKQLLLEKLENENPDINGFLELFFKIFRVSSTILELFDIDIGNLF